MLFADAVAGLAAIIAVADQAGAQTDATRSVTIAEDDLEAALASLLDESLFLLDSRGELPVRADVSVTQGEEARVEATLYVRAAVQAANAIKAVTYHELAVLHVDLEWRATVYFDV